LLQARSSLNGDASSSLPMLPAYLAHLPTGSERGDYFAMDLGGTNFRVRHVSMGGKAGSLKHKSFGVELKRENLTCSVEELFDFMVETSIPFIEEVVDLSTSVPRIGFTFSFPMEQTGINKGRLLRWTKGFTCEGGVGSDPIQLLKDAFRRKGVQVEVPVLANDTVALLAAGRYHHADCRMGIILGTGTNAAYMEQVSNIRKLGSMGGEAGEMAINTEWSDFKGASLPCVAEDRVLDAASSNPGFQLYEKLLSGLWLGQHGLPCHPGAPGF